jgi:hypothetical protein
MTFFQILLKGNAMERKNNSKTTSNGSTLKVFLTLEAFSIFIGFITLLPGKSNHIKEFPGMKAIINREILCVAIPIVIILISIISQKYYIRKNLDKNKE